MKRWLCVVTILVLLLTSVASAEGFSLRNGIAFGDTIDEVLSKETFPIESVVDGTEEETEESNEEAANDASTEETAEDISGDTGEDSEEEDETPYPYAVTTEKTTVAGVDDSYIVYRFDADKTLREVLYHFRSSNNDDTIDTDYESVNDGLIRKYGKPLGYTGGKCYIFTGSALQSAAVVSYLWSEILDGIADFRDYDEWDVKTDDYHVKIEQVEYYTGKSYSELTYYHEMSYTYFTDEDLQAEQQNKQDRQDAVDSDL